VGLNAAEQQSQISQERYLKINSSADFGFDIVTTMIIPISIPEPPTSAHKLPTQLARLGSDEVVLIELQGSLDVESVNDSARDGQLVGKLHIDDSTVSLSRVSFPHRSSSWSFDRANRL
jgi:hypothetical protein